MWYISEKSYTNLLRIKLETLNRYFKSKILVRSFIAIFSTGSDLQW